MMPASNFRSESRKVRIDLQNLPWKGKVRVAAWRIDKDHELAAEPVTETSASDQTIVIDLPANTVLLLKLQPLKVQRGTVD